MRRRILWWGLVTLVSLTALRVAWSHDRNVSVEHLQETARRASSGSLGCGVGSYTFVYADGSSGTVHSGLDAIHVFGNRVRASDLISLLEEREVANRTGKGRMSGERSALLYVILNTLGEAGEPAAVGPAAALLDDPAESARAWAAIALIRIGEQRPASRPQVLRAIAGAGHEAASVGQMVSSRGVQAPQWLAGVEAL